MKKRLIFLSIIIMIALGACSKEEPDGLVLVKGGAFINTNSNFYERGAVLTDFYISKYEVTQEEWLEVMDSNPSQFKGDDLPVEMVSWYDCIEYCNKRSIKEGLEPHYNIDKASKDPDNVSEYDDIKWVVTVNADANGYRLPTEAEWEYAAGGGQLSKSYTYSGGAEADKVAWYWVNAGDEYLSGAWNWPRIEENNNQTNPVGSKEANELGLYDMSGNVREWCWDWYVDQDIESGLYRVWRGGGWLGDSQACETSYRGKYEANGMGADQGFRVCRNK
jgi:sulfatase modifying factor 1